MRENEDHDFHILRTVIYLRREKGWLIGELMQSFTAYEIVNALGVVNLAQALGVETDV